jgi:adenylate kinase family enzyme
MNLQTIVFIGRSGCGKGTQVEQIKNFLKNNDTREIFHLEAGDRFRHLISEKNYTSQLAKEIADKGGLQPEFLSIWAWTDKMVHNLKKDEHLMIDGTPRRLSEAKILESVFDFLNRTDVNVVYLNVSREWAIEGMKERGRDDDKELEDIIARLDWFETDVVPALDFYRAHKSHKFHEVNGEQEIGKVAKDILESIGLK